MQMPHVPKCRTCPVSCLQGLLEDPTILYVGEVEIVEVRLVDDDPFIIAQVRLLQRGGGRGGRDCTGTLAAAGMCCWGGRSGRDCMGGLTAFKTTKESQKDLLRVTTHEGPKRASQGIYF